MFMRKNSGFTLIELLIVIAIILILIAIALPNFLEAQQRAKITRAKSEMRTLGEATASYYTDWGMDPDADTTILSEPNRSRPWWGYASHRLTTPVPHITSIPVDPFPDATGALSWAWDGLDINNGDQNRPYLSVVRVTLTDGPEWGGALQKGDEMWHFASPYGCNPIPGPNSAMDDMNCQLLRGAPWIYFSAGPDLEATLTYLGSNQRVYAIYSATNGTQSTGDLFMPGY